MSASVYWVVGRGGLLGSAIARRIPAEIQFKSRRIPWSKDEAEDFLAEETRRFRARLRGARFVVLWCAGAGIIGTDEASLGQETKMLKRLLNELGNDSPGTFFLASSAGGVYGNSTETPITESTTPRPISAYGLNKLRQEELVGRWAGSGKGNAVVGRISNLYGPGQSLSKPQGLVTQMCLTTLRRSPLSVYVSLDTLRDYLYVDDCAEKVIATLDLAQMDPAKPDRTTKIIASGQSVSIGALLGEASRVLGRRPNCVFMPSPKSTQQGSVLSFRSVIWPAVDRHQNTPIAVGIARTAHAIRQGLAVAAIQGSRSE